jgi:hypothetical protein
MIKWIISLKLSVILLKLLKSLQQNLEEKLELNFQNALSKLK